MTDREKLVELLETAESAVYWNGSDKSFIEKITDHLIAHGVTIKEPNRPMTVEEVRKKDLVYLDERHGRTSCPCFIDPASTEHDMYFFTGLNCVFTHRVKAYNKFWRCWAEKPTEEERKAAEWEK